MLGTPWTIFGLNIYQLFRQLNAPTYPYSMLPVVTYQSEHFQEPLVQGTHFPNTIWKACTVDLHAISGDRQHWNKSTLFKVLVSSQNVFFFNLLSEWNVLRQWNGRIVVLFVIVHPHFSCSSRIFGKNISTSSGECVRMSLTEHMTNSTTWEYF